jgi:hypothetical protein
MSEPTKKSRHESKLLITTSPSLSSLIGAIAQPNHIISHILSYLIHQMGDKMSPRYVNKQWLISSNNIPNMIVRWIDRRYSDSFNRSGVKKPFTSFDITIKQYPRVASFINFPIDDIPSLLDNNSKYSSILLSLQSISLEWESGNATIAVPVLSRSSYYVILYLSLNVHPSHLSHCQKGSQYKISMDYFVD